MTKDMMFFITSFNYHLIEFEYFLFVRLLNFSIMSIKFIYLIETKFIKSRVGGARSMWPRTRMACFEACSHVGGKPRSRLGASVAALAPKP